jgi:hypothetical protein
MRDLGGYVPGSLVSISIMFSFDVLCLTNYFFHCRELCQTGVSKDLDMLTREVFHQDSLSQAWVLDRVCGLVVVKQLILTALLNGYELIIFRDYQ